MRKTFVVILAISTVLFLSCCAKKQAKPEPTEPTQTTAALPTETVAAIGAGQAPANLEQGATEKPQQQGTTQPTKAPSGSSQTAANPTTRPTTPATTPTTRPTTPATTPTTQPTEPASTTQPTDPPTPTDSPFCCEYSRYLSMSVDDQWTFRNSFDSLDDFINWCQDGLAAHEDHLDVITVEGGALDFGDFIP